MPFLLKESECALVRTYVSNEAALRNFVKVLKLNIRKYAKLPFSKRQDDC
jgi:hypothetical protein